jgi:hypothetical protein
LLRRAAPLLRRGPAAPVHPSPGRGSQQFCRPVRKFFESSPPPRPRALPCGNRAEDCRRYPTPPPQFFVAGDPWTSLIPLAPSQDFHTSIYGDLEPGDPRQHPSPRTPTRLRRRTSPPAIFRCSSGHREPLVSITSTPRGLCASCRSFWLAVASETRARRRCPPPRAALAVVMP